MLAAIEIADIEEALYTLGQTLWDKGTRSGSEKLFREKLGYKAESWEEDIVNLLAQEGVLFRDIGATPYDYMLTPVYDRLGGYLIADYLLRYHVTKKYTVWMKEAAFIKMLFGELSDQHELSQDIFHALVALAPKYKPKQQVWQAFPSDYTHEALSLSYLIDRDDFCDDTRDAYKCFVKKEKPSRKILEQLRSILTVVGHPLNADFLDEVLFELTVADRDLSWTEDNRMHHEDRISTLVDLVSALKNGYQGNPEADRLRMVSISWLLTSSVIDLRNLATEALFLYGLKRPGNLFAIAKRLLTVNDPYVSERLLAASYAVTVSLLSKGDKQQCIKDFSAFVCESMFIEKGVAATTHLLSRDYASSLLQAVATMAPDLSPKYQAESYMSPFPNMPRIPWDDSEIDEDCSRGDSPFRMDFENYTIGRLVKGRANYDYKHPEYNTVRGRILSRIKQLGWDGKLFRGVDDRVESMSGYSRGSRPKVERYGKKYSWIAYYEMAGWLSDEKKVDYMGCERFLTDIDPFFPEHIEKTGLGKKLFLGDTSISTTQWISDSGTPDIDSLLVIKSISGSPSPWILLNAYIVEESKKLDRNFYCTIDACYVSREIVPKLDEYLFKEKKMDWPQKPESEQLYSGEIYWKHQEEQNGRGAIRVTVGQKKEQIETLGIKINEHVVSKGGIRQISTPIIECIDARLPCLSYSWESIGDHRPGVSRLFLAPWIVKALNLRFNSTQVSYTDQDGFPAVLFIERTDDEVSNYQELMYVRKDLLDRLGVLTGLVLLQNLHGERRYACVESLHANVDGAIVYKSFESILNNLKGHPT